MKDVTKYPRKFSFIRSENPRQRVKDLRNIERNKNLSFELRGFLRFFSSHSENFNISTKMLKKDKSKHTIYRLLKQAINAGYIQRKSVLVPHDNHQGYRKDYHYIVSETPIFRDNFSYSIIEKNEVSQCPRLQCPLIADSLSNRIVKEKKEKKKKQVSIPKSTNTLPNGDKPPTPPLSLFSRDQVKIKQELYNALVEEYTEPIVTMAIDRMNAYMEQSGKYRGYACHGAKLKHWLEKDAHQYRSKLEKQKQEAEQKQREQKQREEYARWMQQQEEMRLEKERHAQEEANRMELRVKQNMPILEKYKRMYPSYISWDKYSIANGTYSFTGRVEIMSMSAENLEHDLITRISEYEKKLELESKEAEKRTEMGVESNNDAQVVCVVKKMETQSKIGHSVLNQTYPIQKSPRNIGYQAQLNQNRWKNQLNSVLKSYGTYHMKF